MGVDRGHLPPTLKRRARARRAHHHPPYQALGRVLPLCSGGLAASLLAPSLAGQTLHLLELALSAPAQADPRTAPWLWLLPRLCLSALGVLLAAAGGALLSATLAQGLRIRLSKPQWRLSRGSPAGAGQRAARALLPGFVGAFAVAWLLLEASHRALAPIAATDSARAAVNSASEVLSWVSSRLLALGALWLAIDSLWAYRRWLSSLRMTQQQLEEELRETGRSPAMAQAHEETRRAEGGAPSPAARAGTA